MGNFVTSGIFLIICVGGLVLQVMLSKNENKWVGLVLPIISFVVSIMAVLGITVLAVFSTQDTVIINGEIVEQSTRQLVDVWEMIWTSVINLLIFNIPTGILLAIYLAFKGGNKKQRDIAKMNIQDL
jgi:hypothetical protein